MTAPESLNRRLLYAGLAGLALAAGGLLYAGLDPQVRFLRHLGITAEATPLAGWQRLLRNYGPDFCWAFALPPALQAVLLLPRKQQGVLWLCAVSLPLFELGQYAGLFPGTADIWDAATGIISTFCALCALKMKEDSMKKILQTAVIVLVIGAFFLAALGSGSDSGDPTKVGEVGGSQDSGQGETTAAKDFYEVGDIIEADGLKLVYMASGVYESTNQFIQPAEGKQYIFLEFYAENIGTSGSKSISYLSFDGYADGYAADQKYILDDTISGTLTPGRWTRGYVIFEVPKTAEKIEAEYQYGLLSRNKLKFLYGGVKNSGFTPAAKTAPTEGAFKVGDILESKNYRITYVSCAPFESDNMFIKPADGYEFIYIELEFENTDKSDHSVNSLYFHCYADGKLCDSTTGGRDDNLSATLSQGRKAKGTVCFEVPKNAQTIEIEFDEALISGKAIVFSFKK